MKNHWFCCFLSQNYIFLWKNVIQMENDSQNVTIIMVLEHMKIDFSIEIWCENEFFYEKCCFLRCENHWKSNVLLYFVHFLYFSHKKHILLSSKNHWFYKGAVWIGDVIPLRRGGASTDPTGTTGTTFPRITRGIRSHSPPANLHSDWWKHLIIILNIRQGNYDIYQINMRHGGRQADQESYSRHQCSTRNFIFCQNEIADIFSRSSNCHLKLYQMSIYRVETFSQK